MISPLDEECIGKQKKYMEPLLTSSIAKKRRQGPAKGLCFMRECGILISGKVKCSTEKGEKST